MIIVWGFVMFFLLLGFPFFVLVVARKQEGWMKYAGWVLAGLFTLFLLVTGVFAISKIGNGRMGMMAGGGMGCQMMGGRPGMMMGRGGMCGGQGMMMGGPGCCPMMDDNGAEWDKLGDDQDGNVLFERQGPKMMVRMFNKDIFQDEKSIDTFIENLRKDQKVFDQFKTKINAPAPKKETTTKTPTTPTPTTPKNP